MTAQLSLEWCHISFSKGISGVRTLPDQEDANASDPSLSSGETCPVGLRKGGVQTDGPTVGGGWQAGAWCSMWEITI